MVKIAPVFIAHAADTGGTGSRVDGTGGFASGQADPEFKQKSVDLVRRRCPLQNQSFPDAVQGRYPGSHGLVGAPGFGAGQHDARSQCQSLGGGTLARSAFERHAVGFGQGDRYSSWVSHGSLLRSGLDLTAAGPITAKQFPIQTTSGCAVVIGDGCQSVKHRGTGGFPTPPKIRQVLGGPSSNS